GRGVDQRRLLHHGAGRARLHPRRRDVPGARAPRAPRQGRPARRLPPPRLLAVHGHATRSQAAREPLGARAGTVEGVARVTGFWKERRVFVTGATGMVGCWLVKDLLAQGAHVVALVLDADPQSELYRSGDVTRVSVVNG